VSGRSQELGHLAKLSDDSLKLKVQKAGVVVYCSMKALGFQTVEYVYGRAEWHI
jgi:hypothetical protein